MTVLNATQLTNLRTRQHATAPYLSILHPVALLTATVNNGSIAAGARTIAYDGGSGSGFATIAAGMTLIVTTSVGQFKARIKSISGSQSTGSISIGENAIPWGDNQVFSIYHYREIWVIPPTIRGGIQYKDFDIPYSDQGLKPTPILIMGGHRAGRLAAGTITFDLDASASYAMAQGASVASYIWSCVHNGGGTSGITIAASTSATTTLTITDADEYWLSCLITDTNGKGQQGW